MKVVTLGNIPNVPAEGPAERIEGWTGPVARTRQTIIEPGDSKNYNCSRRQLQPGVHDGLAHARLRPGTGRDLGIRYSCDGARAM